MYSDFFVGATGIERRCGPFCREGKLRRNFISARSCELLYIYSYYLVYTHIIGKYTTKALVK